MKLLPPEEFDDTIRVYMWLFGFVAGVKGSDAWLCRSSGSRKSGRATRYFMVGTNAPFARLTAHSDEEAIEKMNARLAKMEAPDEQAQVA